MEQSVQLGGEVTVSEVVEVTTEELSKRGFPQGPDKVETKTDSPEQNSQTLYTDEVELVIEAPVDLKMMSKLYDTLQTIPELKVVYTSGSVNRGATITVTLEGAIPLISVISEKMPWVEATPELRGESSSVGGKSSLLPGKGKDGVRRIKLVLKEGNTSSRG